MEVDPGASLATHRLKPSAIVARETLVMDDFELERLATGMDQARPYDRSGRSEVVGVERKRYDDAIAHAAFRARTVMVQLFVAREASVSRRSLRAMSACMTTT